MPEKFEQIKKDATAPETVQPKPEQPKPKGQQEWLKIWREKSYDAILDEFGKLAERGESAGRHLYKIIEFGMDNPIFRERFKKEFTEKDFEAIDFVAVTSDSASEVAGKKIQRGVFVVNDERVYQKLEKVFWERSGKNHGVVIDGLYFPNIPNYRDVGIILSKNNNATQSHEVRHTIDPYRAADRKGYDGLLAEAFAEYQNLICEKGDWKKFEDFIAMEEYYDTYTKGAEQKMTEDEWRELVGHVVKKIKDLQKAHGDIEIQRIILQAQTIEQLMATM